MIELVLVKREEGASDFDYKCYYSVDIVFRKFKKGNNDYVVTFNGDTLSVSLESECIKLIDKIKEEEYLNMVSNDTRFNVLSDDKLFITFNNNRFPDGFFNGVQFKDKLNERANELINQFKP